MRASDATDRFGELRAALWAAGWRSACLVAAGIALGLVLHAVRSDGVALAGYAPPTSCSASAGDHEPSLLPVARVAELCGRRDTFIADVRSADAYAEGHIAGAVHLPCSASGRDADHLVHALAGKTMLVAYGESSGEAFHVVQQLSPRLPKTLTVVVLDGGWHSWKAADLACASGPCQDCERSTP